MDPPKKYPEKGKLHFSGAPRPGWIHESGKFGGLGLREISTKSCYQEIFSTDLWSIGLLFSFFELFMYFERLGVIRDKTGIILLAAVLNRILVKYILST